MSRPSDGTEPTLFLSPEPPYPLAGGGQMRSAGLLGYLADRGPVDLITFRVSGQPDPRAALPPALVERTVTIELPHHSKSWPSRALRNGVRLVRGRTPLMDRFGGADSAARIEAAVQGRRYSLAVVEHFWCAPYVDLLRRHADRIVLDLHNIESVLHAGCAASEAPSERFVHGLFQRCSERAERELLPRFDLVLAASENDAARARALAPSARLALYPNSIPLRPRPLTPEDAETIVFSGNLEYHPNVSAIKYFRREIWPRLRRERPHLIWRLVGKNEGSFRRMTHDDPRIQYSGPIPDAVEELAKASLVVVPLLAGSGTRVKIMEAWAAARAVVSTPVGAEGLPGRNGETLVIVDSPDAWVRQVSELLDNSAKRRAIGDHGRRAYERFCNWPAAWRALDEALEPLTAPRPRSAVNR